MLPKVTQSYKDQA